MGWGTGPTDFSRDEVLEIIAGPATDPEALAWDPLFGVFGSTLRLRMNMTEETLSEPMITALCRSVLPPEDPPEVVGLLRALDGACRRASVGYRLDPGTRELQPSVGVAFFEPYRIALPFQRATLSLAIAPGEFQWILRNARKEPAETRRGVEQLMAELLRETREWLRRGNR